MVRAVCFAYALAATLASAACGDTINNYITDGGTGGVGGSGDGGTDGGTDGGQAAIVAFSNGVERLLPVATAPLIISGGDIVINSDTGIITSASGTVATQAIFTTIDQPAPGRRLGVFAASQIRFEGPSNTVLITGKNPIAFLSAGDIVVERTLSVAGGNARPTINGVSSTIDFGGPGGFGSLPPNTTSSTDATLGGQGAGIKQGGGAGFLHVGAASGGQGGSVVSSTKLSPLFGGSAGAPSDRVFGGGGAGAVQLSASGNLRVIGAINANGGGGQNMVENVGAWGGGGGGAGGAILLEANTVEVSGIVVANGGGGGGRCLGGAQSTPSSGGTANTTVAVGGTCANTSTPGSGSGNGGTGGAGSTLPGTGTAASLAGGGGSAGRIHIRSRTPYAPADTAVISPTAPGGVTTETL